MIIASLGLADSGSDEPLARSGASAGMSADDYVLAGDIGGTTARIGVANAEQGLRSVVLEPTATDPDDLVAQIARMAREAAKRVGYVGSAAAAAIAVPAAVTPGTGRIHRSDNLPKLNGFPIRERLMETFDLPVILENDVNAAALGEMWQGCASDVPDFVLFAIGTGVGMGIVCGGQLLRGTSGASGEAAYLPIGFDPFDPAVRDCGALTHTASGSAIVALMEDLLASYPTSVLRRGDGVEQIFAASSTGDQLGLEVLRREGALIAQALLSTVALLDPALLLLGGGIGSSPHLLGPVREHLARLIPDPPPVRTAALGNRAGLVGAANMALASLGMPPERTSEL